MKTTLSEPLLAGGGTAGEILRVREHRGGVAMRKTAKTIGLPAMLAIDHDPIAQGQRRRAWGEKYSRKAGGKCKKAGCSGSRFAADVLVPG